MGRLNRQYYGLSGTECDKKGPPVDNAPGRMHKNAPAFSLLNVQERENRGVPNIG